MNSTNTVEPHIVQLPPKAFAAFSNSRQYKSVPVSVPAVSAIPAIGPRRDFNKILQLYIPCDLIAMALGFSTVCFLASRFSLFIFGTGFSITASDIRLFTLILGSVISWFIYTNHYRLRVPFWSETNKILKTLSFAALADGLARIALMVDFSGLWLSAGWLVSAGFIILMRNGLRSQLRRKGLFQVPTLLIGGGETAKETRAALRSEPSMGFEIVAQTHDLSPAFRQEGKSWERMSFAYGAEYVIVALDGQEMQNAEQLIAQLTREGLPFSISPPLRHLPLLGLVPQHFFNHDVMLMTCCNKLEQPMSRFLKRAFDIVVSGGILLFTSPVLLAIALLARRDGGPALYGHMRVGQSGKKFPCLKFRSMMTNGNDLLKEHLARNPQARLEWEATRKLKDDPRVTSIGRFLRKSSLDELPQLLNVLKGDMSLVGPRPIVTDEVANYERDITHYYNVKPGITGLWQVSGRNDVSYAERVKMDSWYVRNWSLWQDIAILLKTIPAVFQRSGAY